MPPNQVVNLNGKSLKEFVAGDSIYVVDHSDDMHRSYLCEFIELRRGIVHAKIVDVGSDRDYLRSMLGKTLTARPSSCYLYGPAKPELHMLWSICHWFKNTKDPAE